LDKINEDDLPSLTYLEKRIVYILGKDFKKKEKYSSKELALYLNKFYEKYVLHFVSAISHSTIDNLINKGIIQYMLDKNDYNITTRYYFLTEIGKIWYQKIKNFESLIFI
jgi:hypothetical protein